MVLYCLHACNATKTNRCHLTHMSSEGSWPETEKVQWTHSFFSCEFLRVEGKKALCKIYLWEKRTIYWHHPLPNHHNLHVLSSINNHKHTTNRHTPNRHTHTYTYTHMYIQICSNRSIWQFPHLSSVAYLH